jgi:hypothetical protein
MIEMEDTQKKNTASETNSKAELEVKPFKKAIEISKEALEERQLLEGLLLQRTERQAEEDRKFRLRRQEE